MDSPLLEDDSGAEGVIEPSNIVPSVDMPECAMLCFFGDVVRDVVSVRPDARQVAAVTSELGSSPVWEIEVGGQRLAVLQPGVGAPMAVAFTEEIIAMGACRLVACGGAGALIPELELGRVVVVDSAVRDEGTSHHYMPRV